MRRKPNAQIHVADRLGVGKSIRAIRNHLTLAREELTDDGPSLGYRDIRRALPCLSNIKLGSSEPLLPGAFRRSITGQFK